VMASLSERWRSFSFLYDLAVGKAVCLVVYKGLVGAKHHILFSKWHIPIK
jgi:hypothetical protein